MSYARNLVQSYNTGIISQFKAFKERNPRLGNNEAITAFMEGEQADQQSRVKYVLLDFHAATFTNTIPDSVHHATVLLRRDRLAQQVVRSVLRVRNLQHQQRSLVQLRGVARQADQSDMRTLRTTPLWSTPGEHDQGPGHRATDAADRRPGGGRQHLPHHTPLVRRAEQSHTDAPSVESASKLCRRAWRRRQFYLTNIARWCGPRPDVPGGTRRYV